MVSKYILVIIISVILIVAYFTLSSENQYERIEIAGSTSVQPVAEKLAQEYMNKHPNIKINVQGGGSSLGIRSVGQGIIDIGTSSKELNSEEKKGLNEYLIGKEGIVVAVNTKNSVDDLSMNQLRDIFSGKIKNWKEVDGSDAPINVVTREDGSGTRKAFEDIVMGKKTEIRADAIVQTSTESVKLAVKQDPNAIGFVSLAHMSSDVKSMKIDGIIPSEETISNGLYKIQRPFLFLTKGEPNGIVKDFIDWVLGVEGQIIVKEEKVVPAKL